MGAVPGGTVSSMTRYVLVPTKKPNPALYELVRVIAASGWQSVVMVYGEHLEKAPPADHVLVKDGFTFNAWANQAFDYLLALEPEPLVVMMNDDIQMRRRQTQRTRAMSRRSQSPTRTPNIRRKPGRNEAR